MTNNFTVAKRFFTVLRNWRDAGNDAADDEKKAAALLTANENDRLAARRDAENEKGKAVGKISSSGVAVSSFNDALRDKDVRARREEVSAAGDAETRAAALRRQARRKRQAADLRYSFGFIEPFI